MPEAFDLGPKPKFVEGGCLCGALRYRIDFPADHDFAASSCICQCTQCRKGTSSLFFIAHAVQPDTNFKWTGPATTLKHFNASPSGDRGFCTACGSMIYWRRRPANGRTSVAVGTIDALYLFGDGADGVEVPEGGFGRALASGTGSHEWCANEIKGVTDVMEIMQRGERSSGDSDD